MKEKMILPRDKFLALYNGLEALMKEAHEDLEHGYYLSAVHVVEIKGIQKWFTENFTQGSRDGTDISSS